MLVKPIKTAIFKEGDDLVAFITKHVGKIKERSVLVVTSKIVALAEGRVVEGDKKEKIRLIHQESDVAVKTKYVWLSTKNGEVLPAAAGIDESNGNGKMILLPKDCYKTAHTLRTILRKKYKVKHLGVIVVDSVTLPFRTGAVGKALGYAGFKGVKMYVGKKDIFGRKFRYERANVADALSMAAVLAMGEGAERQPLAIVEEAPIEFTDKHVSRKELHIPLADDMYAPLFRGWPKKKK